MICNRCIMDDTVPGIVFDDTGCTYCHRLDERMATELRNVHELNSLVDRIKQENRKKPYDCVIGLSGGLDSSWVAYQCVKLGLRPFAIHVDNTWNSDIAEHNIDALVTKLRLKFKRIHVDWDEFKDLQLAFLRSGVPNCEIPTDHALLATLFKEASSLGIRHILSGGNLVTEGIMPESWSYETKDWKHIKAIWKKHGKRYSPNYPHLSLWAWFYYIFIEGIRFVPILNYTIFNPEMAKATLSEELGWKDYGTKHHESVYTRWFQGALLPRKYGIDKRRAFYSSLVCFGYMSRNEALERLELPVSYSWQQEQQDRGKILDKFGLSGRELEDILMDQKAHSDYPSNAWILKLLSGLIPKIKAYAST